MRKRSLLAAGVLGSALIFALPAPARAVSDISVEFSIGAGTYWNDYQNTLGMRIQVWANEYDGNGYLNNGARVEVRCYGDDPIYDDYLLGPGAKRATADDGYAFVYDKYRPANPLVARRNSISFSTPLVVTARNTTGFMNEDREEPAFGDEIYCKVRWVDGDGVALEVKTKTVEGYF